MTPDQARHPNNELTVQINVDLNRMRTRKYPDVHVGELVNILTKKDKMDTERVSAWDSTLRKVTDIVEMFVQKMYKVENWHKLLVRSDILFIKR